MLSRIARQTLFRQRNLLPFAQEQARFESRNLEDGIPVWENEVTQEEIQHKGSLRDWKVTELSDDAPTYPTVYESPERDLVNFPRRVCPDKPAPTRLVVFPENWFKFMYPKMGVAGPYTLGLGIVLLLIQKEYLINTGPEWQHLQAFYMWWYVFTRSQLGNILSEAVHNMLKHGEEGATEFEEIAVANRKEAIECEKEAHSQAGSKKLLFAAKKENVGLQQEAAYRTALMDVYRQVKRRLDYQVEVNKIDSRIKQKFMVDWIINQVNQSLAKTPEKDTLKQCLTDLNTLAARV